MNVSHRATAALALLLLVGCRNPVFDWARQSADEDRTEFAEWPRTIERDGSPARDDRLGERETHAATRDDAVARLLDEAHAAAGRGDAERAAGLYRRVLLQDDRHPEARHRLAILADQRGDFRDAEEHYLIAMVGKPRDPDLLSDVGYSYMLQRRPAECERYLKQALEIAPEHVRAANNLGMLYAAMGDGERAFEMFRRGASDSEARSRVAEAMSARAAPGLAATPNSAQTSAPQFESGSRPAWDDPASMPRLPAGATTEELAAAMREERLRAESSRSRPGGVPESWGDPSFAGSRTGFGAPPPRRNDPANGAHPWNGDHAGWDRQSFAAAPRDAQSDAVRHASAYAPEMHGPYAHVHATPDALPAEYAGGYAGGQAPHGRDAYRPGAHGPVITPGSHRPAAVAAAFSASDVAPHSPSHAVRHSTAGGPAEFHAPASSPPDLWPHHDMDVPAASPIAHGDRPGSDRFISGDAQRAGTIRPAGADGFGRPHADGTAAGAEHASATASHDDARRVAARMGLASGPGSMLPVIEFDPISHPPSPHAHAAPHGTSPGTPSRTAMEQPSRHPSAPRDAARQLPQWPGHSPSHPAGIQQTPRWQQPREAEPAHRLNEYHEMEAARNRRIEELERELAAERARLTPGGGPPRAEFPQGFAPRSYSTTDHPVLQPANIRQP